MTTRIILVGGFLGAGKTTLLAQAAHRLAERGLRAAVITNDQSGDLVDTALIRASAIPVAEVTRGCFCCNFPDLLTAMESLNQDDPYDVILAEPVGSCTDLMATVIRPLRAYHAGEFEVAPLTVLLDPERDLSRFPELVGYLNDRQLAEADLLVLSKADLLAEEAQVSRVAELAQAYPGKQVLTLSAVTGDGIDAWLDLCLSRTSPALNPLALDYQRYADAEAALGWLNATGTLTAEAAFSPQQWMADLLKLLYETFEGEGIEIAHLKAYAHAAETTWKASITRAAISWDRQSPEQTRQAEFILNVRASGEPPVIEDMVRYALRRVGEAEGLETEITALNCFSPAPPQPTFRLTMEEP